MEESQTLQMQSQQEGLHTHEDEHLHIPYM